MKLLRRSTEKSLKQSNSINFTLPKRNKMRILTCLAISILGFLSAGATTFTYLVLPYEREPQTIQLVKTYTTSADNKLNKICNLFAEAANDKQVAQIPCYFIKDVSGEGNLYRESFYTTGNYFHRIRFSQNGPSLGIQGSAKMTINLYNSTDEEHEGKWKIRKIEFGAINSRAENGKWGVQEPDIPCAITINGQTIDLSDVTKVQTIVCEFPEEEQWMNSIEFSTENCAGVDLTKFTIFVEDTDGFNNLDENAGRMEHNSEGTYSIPYPAIGNLGDKFIGYYSLCLFDHQGNPVNYTFNPSSDKAGFDLTSDGEGVTPLDAGLYYACFTVNPLNTAVNINHEGGMPFEIYPSAEGLAINGDYLVKTGKNMYQCAPHPEIEWTNQNNDKISGTWTDALIYGSKPGTAVYWKHFTQEEQEAFKSNSPLASEKRRISIHRSSAEIPAGYTRLSTSSVDLSAGNGNDSGALGLVLARNGAISDPIMVEYTKGTPIPTGIISTEADNILSTLWYSPEGQLTSPTNHSAGTLLIKVTTFSSGHFKTEKIIVK